MTEFCKMQEQALVAQILSRLPPRSLMRFKCIRKSWHALINSPWFASQHLQVYNKLSSSTRILLKRCVRIRTEANKEEIVFSFLNLPNNAGDHENNNLPCVVEDLVFPPSLGLQTRGQYIELPGGDSTVHIIGHCDGIICLNLYTGNLILYNPANKELKILPKPCLPVEDKDTFITVLGFGYDSKSNDYILVNIAVYGEELLGDYENTILHIPKAEMYTLGTDSWKQIQTDYLEAGSAIFWPTDFEMYFQGNIYWLGYEGKKEFGSKIGRYNGKFERMIILFDTSVEALRTMLLPDSFYEPGHQSYGYTANAHLAIWNDSIAVFGFHLYLESFHLWVMDDSGGGKESWTKQFTCDSIANINNALALWGIHEVLAAAKDGHICSYNPSTKRLTYLHIHGLYQRDLQAVVCVSSLISVKGGNKTQRTDK
ncbi:hypothetical protein ABKV19_021986 [Rosa sericea]